MSQREARPGSTPDQQNIEQLLGQPLCISQGRQVRTLVEQVEQAGEHVVLWDGKDGAGQSLASGIYYYKLSTEMGSEAKRAVLLK